MTRETAVPVDPGELLGELRVRACSRQWRPFVQALGAEFAAELDPAEMQGLLARIGRRFGRLRTLPACTSLAELEVAANACWADLDWGRCRLREEPTQVVIEHLAPPINLVLDGDWADGFLQGAYQAWFEQQGLPAGLAVRAQPPLARDVRQFVLIRVA